MLVPVPLPLGVSVIDAAIELFGLLYPHISTKHRTQLIEHFVECLKVTKYNRKEAVLVNIFCGVLCALRSTRKLNSGLDSDAKKGCDEFKAISQQLVMVCKLYNVCQNSKKILNFIAAICLSCQ